MIGTKEPIVGKTILTYKGKTYLYQGWSCKGRFVLLDRSTGTQVKLTKKQYKDGVSRN